MTETIRASSHESGHTVVALSFGFRVDGIEVREGRVAVVCDLDASDRTDMERFVFLAGGIAGEEVRVGPYDRVGCRDDQEKISARGGGLIDTYLHDAIEIIKANEGFFKELSRKISAKIMEKNMEASISAIRKSFKLLTGDEILQFWTASQSRQ